MRLNSRLASIFFPRASAPSDRRMLLRISRREPADSQLDEVDFSLFRPPPSMITGLQSILPRDTMDCLHMGHSGLPY